MAERQQEQGVVPVSDPPKHPPSSRTWGDVFWHHVQKGEDRSSAAARADEWEKRQQRKSVFGTPNAPGYDDAGFSLEFVAAFHAHEDARDGN